MVFSCWILVSCKLDTSSESTSSFSLPYTKTEKALKEGDEMVVASDWQLIVAASAARNDLLLVTEVESSANSLITTLDELTAADGT